MTPRIAPLTPLASTHLDMIRGLAALAVVAGHVRGAFLADWVTLDAGVRSAPLRLIYAATSYGHSAVMVFFVLSGFLVGGGVLKTIDRWSWRRYLVARLTRLYLVLAPALVLGAVLDLVASRLPAGPAFYAHAVSRVSVEPILDRLTPGIFAGNALFLQTIYVPTFGSNSPLWSLSAEFWYYLLFPALVLTAWSRTPGSRTRTSQAIAAVVALALCLWLPRPFFIGFAIWLTGTAVALLPGLPASVRAPVRLTLAVATGALLLGTLAWLRVGDLPEAVHDPLVGVSFAVWLYFVIHARDDTRAPRPLYAWTGRHLSGCSYSVYAVHFPVLMLIRVLLGPDLWMPTPATLAGCVAIAAALVGAGFVFARVTEAHTGPVRAWLLAARPLDVPAARPTR